MTGPHGREDPPETIVLGDVATSLGAVVAAFDQLGVPATAMEGPDLRVVAFNALARQVLQPAFGPLGSTLRGSDWLRGSGIEERILDVYRTGEGFVGTEWPLTLPGPSGQLEERIWDFRFDALRNPDASIRGVLTVGYEVTEQVRRRQAAERASDHWHDRFHSTREAMTALQASMLPAGVPVLPRLELAARYLVAESDTAAGGDWFGAVPLHDGRVALVVGDVVGHGVLASATMGQLRAVLEERLRAGAGIAGALEALDAFSAHAPASDAATVCVVVIDPESGDVEYCTAGHPPPLVIVDEDWRYLDPTGARPLGAGGGFPVARTRLGDGALLVLYSDGLVERPGRTWQQSTVEIGQVVTDALHGRPVRPRAPAHRADRVCEQALEHLTRETGYDDDITVLAARRVSAPDDLRARVPAVAGEVAGLAVLLDRWLADVGAGDDDRSDLRHVALELATNCVDHAGGTTISPVRMELAAGLDASGVVTVMVTDDGEWHEPDALPALAAAGSHAAGGARLRGLGLALVGQLTDRLSVDHSGRGTSVRVARRLRRPAPVGSAAHSVAPRATPASGALEDELVVYAPPDRPGVLVVVGPVTVTTADQLATNLAIESRATTSPLVIDLGGVTHLSSAGVRVLQMVCRSADAAGTVVTLHADAGSVAHHVLGLVGLPVAPTSPDGREGPGGTGVSTV